MGKPVIAAIPHYNMSYSVLPLLAQVADPEQGYDEVVVIDDSSTEEQAAQASEACEAFGATFLPSTENAGPAHTRNRIVHDPRYRDTVLHFLDADVSLDTPGSAHAAREMVAGETVGMAGGLIRDTSGHQVGFNYGPAFTLKSALGFTAQMRVAEMAKTNPQAAAICRGALGFLLRSWPDTQHIRATRTFWVAEANMVVNRDLFAAIGGFGEGVRFHDIVTPAIRMARLGRQVLFDPAIAVTHHDLGDHSRRAAEQREAMRVLIGRHGLQPYLLGGDHVVGKWGH